MIFADAVNTGNTYEGQYLELTGNLDFKETAKTVSVGILDSEYRFSGNFNGNGYSIQNIEIQNLSGEAGLFVNLGGTVSNLAMKNGFIEGDTCGGIASSIDSDGVIVNCYSQILVKGNTAGRIAGKSSGTIVNCVNYVMEGGTTQIVGDNGSGVVE